MLSLLALLASLGVLALFGLLALLVSLALLCFAWHSKMDVSCCTSKTEGGAWILSKCLFRRCLACFACFSWRARFVCVACVFCSACFALLGISKLIFSLAIGGSIQESIASLTRCGQPLNFSR